MRSISTTADIQDYVSRFEMDSFLNDDLLKQLQVFHFPAYSTVFIEQDEQHYLYFLVEGQVQCHHYHLNGKLAVFALSNPFTAIGDLEILNKEPVHSNVITTKDTIMLGIDSYYIHRYGAEDPRFLRFMLDQLREKLYRTNTHQINQLLPVTSRLAAYLLSLTQHDDTTITLPDKEGLASLLGTTTRHLNRVFKELIESGSIKAAYPQITIVDRAALENLTV